MTDSFSGTRKKSLNKLNRISIPNAKTVFARISDRTVVSYIINCIKENTTKFFIKLKACYVQLVFGKKFTKLFSFYAENDFLCASFYS